VAEEYHDEDGLIWPISLAPYHVHLVALKGGEAEADELYAALLAAGVEVLYDDRPESPGVKFADADLIGLPVRLTVSKRSLEADSVEVKRRDQAEARLVKRGEILPQLEQVLAELWSEIQARVVEVPYDA
jgi:prolyl-tRNA synthetase